MGWRREECGVWGGIGRGIGEGWLVVIRVLVM